MRSSTSAPRSDSTSGSRDAESRSPTDAESPVERERSSRRSFVFFGVSMVLFGVVRATGAVMVPLFVLAFSLLVVRFPLAETLQGRYHLDAVWWSFPISSALAAVLAVIYYKYGGWRTARMIGGPTQPVAAPSPES